MLNAKKVRKFTEESRNISAHAMRQLMINPAMLGTVRACQSAASQIDRTRGCMYRTGTVAEIYKAFWAFLGIASPQRI